MPNGSSEVFGNRPNNSETFRNRRKTAEPFRSLRNDSERDRYTLTVREVARLFEVAGVNRTERSITNWCLPNKVGVARLDSYFDPNERKYFITAESVEAAIEEERARAAIKNVGNASPDGNDISGNRNGVSTNSDEVKSFEQEIIDLKIMNRGKDYLIEELRKERAGFNEERQRYVEELMRSNRRVGELETKLNQIEAPRAKTLLVENEFEDQVE